MLEEKFRAGMSVRPHSSLPNAPSSISEAGTLFALQCRLPPKKWLRLPGPAHRARWIRRPVAAAPACPAAVRASVIQRGRKLALLGGDQLPAQLAHRQRGIVQQVGRAGANGALELVHAAVQGGHPYAQVAGVVRTAGAEQHLELDLTEVQRQQHVAEATARRVVLSVHGCAVCQTQRLHDSRSGRC